MKEYLMLSSPYNSSCPQGITLLRISQFVRFAVLAAIFAFANFANAENNSLNESLDINPQDKFDDATNHDITPVWNPINRTLQRDVDNQTENDEKIKKELDEGDITKTKNIDSYNLDSVDKTPGIGDSRKAEGGKSEKPATASESPENGEISEFPDISTETITKPDGGIIVRIKHYLSENHIEPICFVTKKMRDDLTKTIREKEKYLYKRWVPPISWNVGASMSTAPMDKGYRGYQTADGSYYSNNDYPDISTSISIPIYNPDKEAERDRGRQGFLSVMLGRIRNIELLQVQIFQYREKMGVLSQSGKLQLEGVGNMYEIETAILKNIVDINENIRFLESELEIDMLEVQGRVEGKVKEKGKSWLDYIF